MLFKLRSKIPFFRFSETLKPSFRNKSFINPNLIQLKTTVQNQPGVLSKILQNLNEMNVNIHNIESNFRNGDWENVHVEIFVENLKENNTISDFAKKLSFLNCVVTEMKPTIIPDFPIKLSDLDDFDLLLQNLDQNLSNDHPGFNDPEYKKRRDYIAQESKNYKMGDAIPFINYNETETDLWKFLFGKLRPLVLKHANKDYIKNLKILEDEGIFSLDEIPQLDVINKYLNKKTNWRIKPVNGILSQREYLNCLAFRTFPSTQYIRHPSRPLFTPEPDLVHEFVGHVPNFCDPVFCDISQEIGILSLGASDSIIKILGSVYWFTVEFGCCKEDGLMKFYGSGLAGGLAEIDNFLKCKDLRKLDISKHFPPTEFVIQDVQPFYYYIDDFSELLKHLRLLSTKFAKPFKYTMNSDSTAMYIDRTIETYPEESKIDMFN